MGCGSFGRVLLVLLLSASCGTTSEPAGEGEGEGEGEGGDPCALIQCPPSSTCVEGSCQASSPCDGVQCEAGFVCSAGSCVNALLDEDGDGYPAEVDCDDRDPDVVPGSVVACSTDCGDGTTTCASGRWSECSAPSTCTCRPGETRDEPCGRCGTATRACGPDGEWVDGPGACQGEGECSPGAVEVNDCGRAGTCEQQSRTCSASCVWGPFDVCIGQDECAPDDLDAQACGNCGARERTCSDQCLWGSYGACAGEGACTPGATEQQACPDGAQDQIRTCGADCAWGAWSQCPIASECRADDDCVAATCCHPSACVPVAQRPDCAGIFCSQECRAGTMDCGQGHCECQASQCVAVIAGGA